MSWFTKIEEVGVLRPCEEPEEVCTLTSRKGWDGYQGGTSDVGVKEAIAQLIPNDVDLPPYVSLVHCSMNFRM